MRAEWIDEITRAPTDFALVPEWDRPIIIAERNRETDEP